MATDSLTRDLTQGSISSHLIKQAVPMLIGLLVLFGVQLANVLFVGHLGAVPLAIVSFSMPVYMVAYNIVFGCAIATGSLVSRAVGAGDHHRAAGFITAGLVLVSIAMTVFYAFGHLTVDWLFPLLGATPEMMPDVRAFMQIWYVSTLILGLPIVGNAGLRALGNAKRAAQVMILIALVGLTLDALLILGLFGAPRLGLGGVAVSMICSYAVAGLFMLFILNRSGYIAPCRTKAQFFEIYAELKQVFKLAIPTTLNNLLAPLSSFFIMGFVGHFGAQAVAGFGAGIRVDAMVLALMMALVSSMGPVVGQNFGAGNMDRARAAIKTAIKWLLGIYATLSVLMVLAALMGAGYMLAPSVQVASIVTLFFFINAVGYMPNVFNAAATSALNTVGRARLALLLNVGKFLVLQVPLAWLGGKFFGVGGVFGGVVLGHYVAACASFVALRHVFWQQKTP